MQDIDYSELFSEPPKSQSIPVIRSAWQNVPRAAVSCVVCHVRCEVSIDALCRLCTSCAALGATRLHAQIKEQIEEQDRLLSQEIDRFERVLKQASAQDRQRYERVFEMRLKYVQTEHETTLRQKELQARQARDGLAFLLRTEADYLARSETISNELARLNEALDDLRLLPELAQQKTEQRKAA